jgi:hypothetical protein
MKTQHNITTILTLLTALLATPAAFAQDRSVDVQELHAKKSNASDTCAKWPNQQGPLWTKARKAASNDCIAESSSLGVRTQEACSIESTGRAILKYKAKATLNYSCAGD